MNLISQIRELVEAPSGNLSLTPTFRWAAQIFGRRTNRFNGFSFALVGEKPLKRLGVARGTPLTHLKVGVNENGILALNSARSCHAFSLIEILVTVALLSFIILGLLAMFTQTKRAFTSSMTQVDVLESGRAIVEMIARDLEQMTPTHAPYFNNGNYRSTNFFAEVSRGFDKSPFLQGLPGTTYAGPGGPAQRTRTNIIQRFFFVSQLNKDWIGTGYQVLPDDPQTGGVGTLYRASSKVASRATSPLLSSNFHYVFAPNRPITNLNRIAGGIVHLRLQAFATNGYPIAPQGFLLAPNPNSPSPFVNVTNAFRFNPLLFPGHLDYYFISNAVPAYVELELGILEPKVLERFKSMAGNRTQQLNYLSNHVAQVHIFRQWIPIRNVDFAAYR